MASRLPPVPPETVELAARLCYATMRVQWGRSWALDHCHRGPNARPSRTRGMR